MKNYDPFRESLFAIRNRAAPVPKTGSTIPKIVHQFWIGDLPFPEIYRPCVDSFRNLAGFQHRFWTNKDIPELLCDPIDRGVYDAIPERDWAVRKDFLAYLVLSSDGGLVADVSIWCRKSPAALHLDLDHYFYFPYERAVANCWDASGHALLVWATIMAGSRRSEIFGEVVEAFRHFVYNFESYNRKYTGPEFPNRERCHGWMNQILMNEAIDRRLCVEVGEKVVAEGLHVLSESQYHRVGIAGTDEMLFVDCDYLQVAQMVKSLHTARTTLDYLLNINQSSP